MPINRNRNRFRRFAFAAAAVFLCAALLAACSQEGINANPDDLLKQTISGLSGTDDFQFEGTTRIAVGSLPMQAGSSFKGSVAGHNRLVMSFDGDAGGGGTAVIESIRARQSGGSETVVFDRKEKLWTLQDHDSEGSAAMLLPWSPLYKLEQLNTMDKKVESGRDSTRMTVLTVTPDAAAITNTIKAELSRQAEGVSTDKQLADLRAKFGLTDREAERMRSELDQTVRKTKSSIEEAGSSMQASSVYRIWVDRTSRLPRRMQVETEMNYRSGGQPKQEKTHIDYTFTSYENRPVAK
ncbi:hypothetical protein [Paenibacillus ginsengarvi]|uniref:Lipoprotein n=1 Tax=Paenibacillus ginsengarvi TaxID=400777 RepID=A0A3B0CND0_9BACL|nr:hypothetical protein [Paenibacillus ginsengarvi]RKN86672.1 hypothetical protein D7M11_01535 [Paenibacillus ginsengarvi]